MHGTPMWMRIMQFEMALGPSDECHSCGAVFLAHSDGCPKCGGYRTSKLHPLEREKWNMENYPVIIWSMETGELQREHVDLGDFSPWPRVQT